MVNIKKKKTLENKMGLKIPWPSSGEESTLSLLRMWV